MIRKTVMAAACFVAVVVLFEAKAESRDICVMKFNVWQEEFSELLCKNRL